MAISERTEQRRLAPYVSFAAFRKLLDRMAGEHGPPGRIDRSYLTGMSGGYQAQLLAALRSLELIDSEGVPTQELKRLTADLEAELPGFMQRRVALLYPEAVALAEANGSAGQLAEAFRSVFGFTGSTLESAIRFYLDASQFAGMRLSAHFRPPTRGRKARVRRSPTPSSTKATAPRVRDDAQSTPPPTVGAVPSSTQRVELSSGGNLVLTMSVDLFSLTDDDRTFVFDIVDRVKAYKGASGPAPQASPAEPPSQDGSGG